MTDSTQPTTGNENSKFGYPLESRKLYFKEAESDSSATHRIPSFMGHVRDLPILTVPIGLPKYRLLNGRTASAQEEYLAKHTDLPKDFFDDPERIDVQQVQHKILLDLLFAGGLRDKFEDPKVEQVEPLLLDEYGYVINGNRRLCSWRELFYGDSEKYQHFSHIDVVVLPHSDDQEIDRLEAALQIEKDIRADYVWHSTAKMMKQRQSAHNLKMKDLISIYKMKKGELEELFEMHDYAVEYLKSRGKEGMWSEVSDEEAFRRIVKERRKSKGTVGEKELFKEIAFVLLDDPDEAGGRLYDAIPNANKYIGPISKKLIEELEVQIDNPEPSDDNLFSAGDDEVGPEIAIMGEISKETNKKKARKVIREVIEDQKALANDAETAMFLLKMLNAANGRLEAAVATGLRPDAVKEGVESQVEAMESKLKAIRDWLESA